MLRVAVGAEAPAILGKYTIADSALRFTPLFPFDQGRHYMSGSILRVCRSGADAGCLSRRRSDAGVDRRAFDLVARVYPSGDVVPENLLRMYVEFRRRWDARAASSTSRCSTTLARRFRVLSCRSTTSSGARTTAVHRVLRSRPSQERHSAEPADGPAARSGAHGDARHQPGVA